MKNQKITSKELRVDNLILHLGRIHKTNSGDIALLEGKGFEEDYKPIPLNQEWLLKFGFEYVNPFGYRIKRGCFVKDDLETNGYYFRWNGQTLSLIYYVHQLQNLHYCLCGEELELTL